MRSLQQGFFIDIPDSHIFFVDQQEYVEYQKVLAQAVESDDGWKMVNSFGSRLWPVAVGSVYPFANKSGAICVSSEFESIKEDCWSIRVFCSEVVRFCGEDVSSHFELITGRVSDCCQSFKRRVCWYSVCVGIDPVFRPTVEEADVLKPLVDAAKFDVGQLECWIRKVSDDGVVSCFPPGDLHCGSDSDESVA